MQDEINRKMRDAKKNLLVKIAGALNLELEEALSGLEHKQPLLKLIMKLLAKKPRNENLSPTRGQVK